MIIIFDFNRTLYDPDTNALLPGASKTLSALAKRATLHLVSRREGARSEKLKELGIAGLFRSAAFVDDKDEAIAKLVHDAGNETVYVVGDHPYGEIRSGNRHGAKTVRLLAGPFATLPPETEDDEPWRTVTHLDELIGLLH